MSYSARSRRLPAKPKRELSAHARRDVGRLSSHPRLRAVFPSLGASSLPVVHSEASSFTHPQLLMAAQVWEADLLVMHREPWCGSRLGQLSRQPLPR